MSASSVQSLPQSCETRGVKPTTLQKVTAKVKRKYHSLTTFSSGFFGTGVEEDPKPVFSGMKRWPTRQ